MPIDPKKPIDLDNFQPVDLTGLVPPPVETSVPEAPTLTSSSTKSDDFNSIPLDSKDFTSVPSSGTSSLFYENLKDILKTKSSGCMYAIQHNAWNEDVKFIVRYLLEHYGYARQTMYTKTDVKDQAGHLIMKMDLGLKAVK